jgi:hypothetical protein
MSDANGWLPIETAPKTGKFLTYSRLDGVELVWVYPSYNNPNRMTWQVGSDYRSDSDRNYRPTHWQPLPGKPIANTPDTMP